MSADESASLEEQFPLLLAACDEALTVGAPAASVYESAAPAELRPRLEREADRHAGGWVGGGLLTPVRGALRHHEVAVCKMKGVRALAS